MSLQATCEGQAAHAHVHEIIAGLRSLGWEVDLYQVEYPQGASPGILARLVAFYLVQLRLWRQLPKYNVVYARTHLFAFPIALLARRLDIPVVQECNGPYDDLYAAWPVARYVKSLVPPIMRLQFRSAARNIAVTPALAEFVNLEADREDTAVVPNGANVALFRPGLEPLPGLPEFYVIFFGALSVWQGLPTILEAVTDEEWPEHMMLVIAGDGALRHRVENAAAANPRVIYTGILPYSKIPRAVANAKASLIIKGSKLHAKSGLSPLKLYESMAAGAPVIASEVAGLATTVNASGAGLVVPPDDSRAVARAVSGLAADLEGAKSMGAAGRAYVVAHASWEARAAQTDSVIQSALLAGATALGR